MIFIKKLKLIYNDKSGNRGFKNDLDAVIKIFAHANYDINILRTTSPDDIEKHLKRSEAKELDTVVACGGDGTINLVVNTLLKYNLPAKLGIIPAGTANDFARYLGIEKSATTAARIITHGHTKKIDVGTINGKYFINVFGSGLLTNISNHVDPAIKNTLGNMAYYLKGIEKLNSIEPMPISIKHSGGVIEEDIYFMLALNTSCAGGFDRLVDAADPSDGYLDFVALKSCSIPDIMSLIVKFMRHDHLNDDNIIYFRDTYAEIYGPDDFETNIDGEHGINLPAKIGILPSKLDVFVPHQPLA